MRLQKYLAHAGIASRRQSEKLILDGRIQVNGKVVTELGTKIDPKKDEVFVDGYEISDTEEKVYYILNKPDGYVTTTSDEKDRPTIIDLIDCRKRVYPVGRLDVNTRGLLLLSNDGIITFRLTHPSFAIPKTYNAWVKGEIRESNLNKLAKGVKLEDGFAKPKIVKLLEVENNKSLVEIVLTEGRKRQVRRMLKKIGYPVVDLKRTKFANLTLTNLSEGQYRELTENELYNLKKMIDLI